MKMLRYGNTLFHFNSDLSGDVIIENRGINFEVVTSFKVKGEYLIDFIAEYVRQVKINTIEKIDTETVLGVKSD